MSNQRLRLYNHGGFVSAFFMLFGSWIAVTYGKKRLKLLKDRFPSIQFESIERVLD